MPTMLELAAQGKLGPYRDPQAAVDNYYKTHPLAAKMPESAVVGSIIGPTLGIPSTPEDTGAIGWMDVLRGPAIAMDGSGRNIGVGQDIQHGTLVNDRSGDPAKPVLVQASQQVQTPDRMDTTDGRQFSENVTNALNDGHFMNVLPSHLKPRIEKDADGNEVVSIQGSLLNKIMKDMYSAGRENYEAAAMATPAAPQSNPYDQSRVQMQNQATPQAELMLRELMNTYPGRTPDEIARILRGGK